MSGWVQGPLLSFDSESTGTDPWVARVVTAAAVYVAADRQTRTVEWILDPGVDVPSEAAAIHGWTRDKLLEVVGHEGQALRREDGEDLGMTAEGALFEIATTLAQAMGNQLPLVIHNAPYDLTLVEAELNRFGIDSLASRPSGIRGVVDTMVIEKNLDQWRKTCFKAPGCDFDTKHHECGGCRGGRLYDCGGCGVTDRTLGSLCKHYAVPLDDAHNAGADAMAAARLSVRLAHLSPLLKRTKLETLFKAQPGWKVEQAKSLRDFWRKKGDQRWHEVDLSWPLASTPVKAAS